MVPINYLAVAVGAVFSVVLGFLWYGPLFGKQWIRLSGMTDEQLANAKASGMKKEFGIVILTSFLMTYVLAHALVFASSYLHVEGVQAGLTAGFWNWLGFIVPVTISPVLWEKKPWKLWFLNIGYYLVLLSCVGVLLAVWK